MLVAIYGGNIDIKWKEKIEFLFSSLFEANISLCYYIDLYDTLTKTFRMQLPAGEVFSCCTNLPSNTSSILVLGGDGTFLNSLSFVQDKNIPIAGINLGRLGFLTTTKLNEEVGLWIDDLKNGRFEIEKRTIIEVVSDLPGENFPFALNEVSIQRNSPSMLGIEITIDGDKVPIYWADGFLIATPTGSTAYSLSVGGPIVMPGANVFIVAPIAPHNLNIRPLIVPDTSEITIRIHSRSDGAMLTLDNRSFKMNPDDKLVLRKANFKLNYITPNTSDFFEVLKEKLLWGEDKRNNI